MSPQGDYMLPLCNVNFSSWSFRILDRVQRANVCGGKTYGIGSGPNDAAVCFQIMHPLLTGALFVACQFLRMGDIMLAKFCIKEDFFFFLKKSFLLGC